LADAGSFLWENVRSFPIIEELYPKALRELVIGSHEVISIKFVVHHMKGFGEGSITTANDKMAAVRLLFKNSSNDVRSFPIIEELYPKALRELVIGSHEVISIK
jgi:hypothetical protein